MPKVKVKFCVKKLFEYPNLLWTLTVSFIIVSLPCERSWGADL